MQSHDSTDTLQKLAFWKRHQKPKVETSFKVRVISGNSNPSLAASICACLNIEPCSADVKTFANGEISIKIHDSVRGDDCFIVQPTSGNATIDVNTAMMELLLMIHTLKLSSAARITAIVPYFAYSRQDRKLQARVPISASAAAQLIQSMGVDRVMTLDLHCGQIQGFFRNTPVDNLLMFPEFCRYIQSQPWFERSSTAIISPDAGGVERANVLADRLGASHIVTILKRRIEAGKVDSMQTVGNVRGFTCIIIDDMIDTAGTLVKACELLKEMGATKVIACASHGILTDPACERIASCQCLEEVVVSDSIPQTQNKQRCSKLTVLSIAPMVAQAVANLHKEDSLSSLFQ